MTIAPSEHPELAKLRTFGVADEQIEPFQVLCLPENLTTANRKEELRDAYDAISLAKRLKDSGVSCATSYDLTPEAGIVQRRGTDLWLGTVWVLQDAALPMLANAMSDLLGSWTRRTGAKGKAHVRLRFRGDDDVSEIHYSGDGHTLSRMLAGLKSSAKADHEEK
jgi:hypothetical protein